ncbi:hypothetical protein GCM10018954_059310 [Kutzneria kofuensis]
MLDLLAGAASWLRGRGIEQWPERFPMESVRDQIAGEKRCWWAIPRWRRSW